MEFIIQGDNKPIVLKFDEPCANIDQFSAILYSTKQSKRWSINDVIISGNEITLPLTQDETMKFTDNYVNLEVKFVANDDIEFFETITMGVKTRRDMTVFEIGGDRL